MIKSKPSTRTAVNLKKDTTLISTKLELALWSCDTGQQKKKPCVDSFPISIIWMSNIRDVPMAMCHSDTLAPSTLIHFQTKTELFCSRYGYRPHYNAKNNHQKWSDSKMLSRVERFENDAFWKRCFLVLTKKTMLFENDDVIKIDTTGRQTTRPWLSKMADRCYHVASILRQLNGPISWNAHAPFSFENGLVWTGPYFSRYWAWHTFKWIVRWQPKYLRSMG